MEWGYAASLWGSRGAAALSCTQPRWEAARAQAWPEAVVQLCGTRLLPRRCSGADLALSAVLGGEGFAPFLLRG